MKDFISKNWKKIFYVIGGALIVIDLFLISTTPGVIPQDFLKYGPDIESDIFDSSLEVTDNIEAEVTDKIEETEGSGDDLVSNIMGDDASVSPELMKGLMFFGIAFIVIMVLSAVIDGSSGGSAKKKK